MANACSQVMQATAGFVLILITSAIVTDAHILSYFSVFYTDLFDEVFVFESLSLVMIRWSVMCCHHVHS